jgi:hypothetical protein
MSSVSELLKVYAVGVQYPEVSGFEVLELLDIRSRLAQLESQLTPDQRAQLEQADQKFLQHVPQFYKSLSAVGSIESLRAQAQVPCSHWWWYLDHLVNLATATT